LVWAFAWAVRAGAELSESAIKAEYIVRFARFVDWPSDAGPAGDQPFVVCQMGDSPLGGQLQSIIPSRRIKDRTAILRYPKHVDELEPCHIVIIARTEQAELPQILDRTAARPILTVGDGEGLAERGVLIDFYVEPPFVRFEINVKAAKASGLKFSSQLLRLGRLVGGPL
jgi:hypothetical protein